MLWGSLDGRGAERRMVICIYVYIYMLSPFAVHLKRSQHCSSAILQYKITSFKKTNRRKKWNLFLHLLESRKALLLLWPIEHGRSNAGEVSPNFLSWPNSSVPVSWNVVPGLLPLITQLSFTPDGSLSCAADQSSSSTASQVNEPSELSNLAESSNDCGPSWPTAATDSEIPSKKCWSELSQPTRPQKIIINCLEVACYTDIENWNKEAPK